MASLVRQSRRMVAALKLPAAIRVTVVRAADRTPVTRPIDLTNKKPKISYSFYSY